MDDSNDETNCLHVSLLIDTQNSRIGRAFANDSIADIKYSKTKMVL